MNEHKHNEDLMEGVTKEYQDILDNSNQAIYIFLDDSQKVCNEKFASLLGYESVQEWADVKENFPDAFVEQGSQEALVTTYQKAMEQRVGSKIKVTWKKKSGGTVDTEVILVPISYQRHLFALHFIS